MENNRFYVKDGEIYKYFETKGENLSKELLKVEKKNIDCIFTRFPPTKYRYITKYYNGDIYSSNDPIPVGLEYFKLVEDSITGMVRLHLHQEDLQYAKPWFSLVADHMEVLGGGDFPPDGFYLFESGKFIKENSSN